MLAKELCLRAQGFVEYRGLGIWVTEGSGLLGGLAFKGLGFSCSGVCLGGGLRGLRVTGLKGL